MHAGWEFDGWAIFLTQHTVQSPKNSALLQQSGRGNLIYWTSQTETSGIFLGTKLQKNTKAFSTEQWWICPLRIWNKIEGQQSCLKRDELKTYRTLDLEFIMWSELEELQQNWKPCSLKKKEETKQGDDATLSFTLTPTSASVSSVAGDGLRSST